VNGLRSLVRSLAALRALIGRFSEHLRPQRALLGGSLAAILLETAMRVLEPWPLKFILDRLAESPDGGARESAGIDWTLLLILCAAGVVVLAGLRALAAWLSTVGLSLVGGRVLAAVRADVFAHVQRLSLGFHSRAKLGDLLTRITGDVSRLQEVAVTAVLPLVANVLTLVAMVGVMLWLDWQLTLAVILVFPLVSLVLARGSGKIRGAAREQRAREGSLASGAMESLGAIRVVQTLGLEGRLEQHFASDNTASLHTGVRAKRLAAGLERRVDVLVGVGTALVLLFGAQRVDAGAMTIGDLVVFTLYLKTAFKPLRDMAKYTGRLARAAASAERIVELLDTEVEIRERPGARTLGRAAGAVRLRDVGLRYDTAAAPALDGVDLDIEPGMRVALVGASGSGKSSLLSLLPRLYDPTSGTVELDGHDLRELTLASLRGQFAAVLQDSVLFGMSVRENLALGAHAASPADIERAARAAGAHDFVLALPEGYDTVLGERGATLSGGQRQRLATARAIVRDAPILLLDEPLTGLDEASERLVRDALDALAAERTTILVTHDLGQARGSHLIAVVDRGRIVERGTHDELMALGAAYARTWDQQRAGRLADLDEVVST